MAEGKGVAGMAKSGGRLMTGKGGRTAERGMAEWFEAWVLFASRYPRQARV